ncbi:WD40 repeat domain-containing protein [Rhodotorula paludigena]|uniref:WD40 repeat domain-containing protein n=1 Tax=Rhodotorula paludigena TaxID=86838 RepID=UPI003181BBD9
MAIASSSSSAGEDFSRFTARRIGSGTGRDRVRSVAWNLDGRRLATGGTDKSLRIFLPDKDVRSGTEYRGHTGEISVVRWNPTHPERLATVSSAAQDKGLRFWDLRQGSKPTSVIETNGMNITMTWSPDGRYLVVGNRSDDIMWIDADEQTVIRKTRMPKETNEAFFSHNSTLLTTLVFGDAQIVAFPSNEPVHSIPVANLPITVGDLDPRGRYMAFGSNDTTLSLWETQDFTCVATSGAHDDHVRTCRFSHDGAYLASSSSGQNIHIHNVPTLSEAHVLPVSGGAPADALAWHPTKNVLAYAGQDAWIWGAGV